jgi:hypothetical protein
MGKIIFYPSAFAPFVTSLENATIAGAEYLLEEANKTVPLDKGPLKESGRVEPMALTAEVPELTIGSSVTYNTDYAAIHSLDHNPSYHYQGTGRARWLELTADEKIADIEAIVMETLAKELGL